MSLEQTRLDLAVRMAVRALRAQPDGPAEGRVEAFRKAYRAVTELHAGTDDWTTETLVAAWELTEDAFPRGGPIAEVVAGLKAAHAAIVTTAAPPATVPRRPRRDG
jgi:hypothetical protein